MTFIALDLAVDEGADAVFVLFVERVPLGFAQPLEEALLDCLGCDSSELCHLDLDLAFFVLDGDLGGGAVNGHDQVFTHTKTLANTLG